VIAAATGGHAIAAATGGQQLNRVLIGGAASLLICIFLSPKFINFLRLRSFGQQVRDDGPQGHLTKSGTPTMGGIIMFTALAAPYLVLAGFAWNAIGVFLATLACAMLGFIDDYMKIVRQRSLGLRARTKLIALALISVGLWWVAVHKAHVAPQLDLYFVHDHVDLGIFFPVLIYLVVAGTTSGVNLTDGLDGLAAGCAAIILLAYVLITSIHAPHTSPMHYADLALFASCLLGVCVGFLWFNAFPATIFMGDTGSLGLGGAIAGLAVMTHTEILLLLLGWIFVMEALSVLIQVVSFQGFRKRIFMMAPIHHHFELKGWSETKIILRFWIIAAVAAAIGFVIYQHSIK
jgi:phospho-N-acetylmuramoyl-pentapeptide-transferase